ncbi:Uncharacterised protein [Burkholderia pseudomallei]|nr:Uncharacterised protein [Burkholderia pseudomallei]CAJ4852401.1 Uncharacterised protein [Burkholderia pseudomallei]CAJ5689057.1 Uncharacterised protein [Burkholderia pseudomallei]CAJ9727157.1 Uncharacterised protein [Burkholderia pseudomallei]
MRTASIDLTSMPFDFSACGVTGYTASASRSEIGIASWLNRLTIGVQNSRRFDAPSVSSARACCDAIATSTTGKCSDRRRHGPAARAMRATSMSTKSNFAGNAKYSISSRNGAAPGAGSSSACASAKPTRASGTFDSGFQCPSPSSSMNAAGARIASVSASAATSGASPCRCTRRPRARSAASTGCAVSASKVIDTMPVDCGGIRAADGAADAGRKRASTIDTGASVTS